MRYGTSKQGVKHASRLLGGETSEVPIYATGGYLKKGDDNSVQVN